jgi:uncharacterized glyoxalase superfamily protein PhnB
MTDDLSALRRLRPDQVHPDYPAEPTVFSRHKEQLMSTIGAPDFTNLYAVMPDIYPRLAYDDERAAVDYLSRVFGFEEIREARMETGDTMLAWLRTGTGVLMVGHTNEDVHRIASPATFGGTTVQMMVYVHDIDAHYEHALAAGAVVTMELQDAFYGERRYEATDPEGHRWHFGERFADIVARGGTVSEHPEGGLEEH